MKAYKVLYKLIRRYNKDNKGCVVEVSYDFKELYARNKIEDLHRIPVNIEHNIVGRVYLTGTPDFINSVDVYPY